MVRKLRALSLAVLCLFYVYKYLHCRGKTKVSYYILLRFKCFSRNAGFIARMMFLNCNGDELYGMPRYQLGRIQDLVKGDSDKFTPAEGGRS